MVVITLTDSPPQLRGDLSKWLIEINTGVYAGRINTRVREALWKRVCENIRHGQATMVYTSNNEQHMEFRTHRSAWEPIDYDGITLMRHPSSRRLSFLAAEKYNCEHHSHDCKSNIEKRLQARRFSEIRQVQGDISEEKNTYDRHTTELPEDYAIVDVETTGVRSGLDEIIEIAALRIERCRIISNYNVLISIHKHVPSKITELTGITNSMLSQDGVPLAQALGDLNNFIGDLPIVGHNIAFDIRFLEAALESQGMMPLANRLIDTMRLAKQKISDTPNYKLSTLAEKFGFDTSNAHRALVDCHLAYNLLEQLRTM